MAEREAFEARLDKALGGLGLAVSGEQAQAMLGYLDQLQRWNKTYNLTAVRDPSHMLVQHIFDSLSLLPLLREHWAGKAVRIADLGSGAGLPGIILGICQPEWAVVCVDAVEKKTAFVRQVCGILGLANVQAMHGRIEQLPPLDADIVISRALASLRDFAVLGARHRSTTGVLMAMKGQYPETEVDELERHTDWRVVCSTTLHVPEMKARRCLLELGLKESHDCR